MLELKQRFDLPNDVPSQPEKIREAFPDWLTQTAGCGRIVLVLDALNQLEDVDNARLISAGCLASFPRTVA
jgi:hypothetical protein